MSIEKWMRSVDSRLTSLDRRVRALDTIVSGGGPGLHHGTAAGVLLLVGAAAADRASRGAATGTVAYAGTAAGATVGSAAGTLVWAGVVAGKRKARATGGGTVTWAGGVAGHSVPRGTAAGAWAFASGAQGKRRARATGAGTFTWSGVAITTTNVILMGCNTSPNDHGGTENWDGWRTYNESNLYTYSNRTGVNRPIFMAYSKGNGGRNLGSPSNGTFTGTYASIYAEVLADLNEYYYTGGATSQVHSGRWGIKLYWSNGNENMDKGALALPHTAQGIGWYTTSMQALYAACHYIDPATGQRRFPDAYAGSNPVTYSEVLGQVADWLHPTAQYHDFVMWSMYPAGREETEEDPTYDWPSFNEANRNVRAGWLLRCFYRTKLAEAVAGHPLLISCGEIGTGNDPGDNTTRPYYAVHSLARGMRLLSAQYQLTMPFACWWDEQVDSTRPQNILSDEDPATNPSTREAWQGAMTTYDHTNGGTHPASWAGNPKTTGPNAWKTTGTPI